MPAGDVAGPAVVVEVELLVAVAAEQVKASGPYQTGSNFSKTGATQVRLRKACKEH